MDLTVLNREYVKESIVDVYKSMIWTDRYNAAGDFEIYVLVSEEMLNIFQNGYYIQADFSDSTMIVENMSITTENDGGAFLAITGRSLESILERRIIWTQTIFNKGFPAAAAIAELVYAAIINPNISNRKISNFIFREDNLRNSPILDILLDRDIQFTGDNLYEAIQKICDLYNIGFRITLNNNNQFVFELYLPNDRSYDQDENPYVEFSPSFDNLISSDYKIVTTGYKNVTLVAGEGEGVDRKTVSVNSDLYSGLDRRELYTDARDLSTNTEDGTISDDEYNEMLENRGLSKLTETQVESNFDASVDHTQPYVYNEDYFIGDIVEFQNQFGISYRVRVSELIHSESLEGVEQYPTFTILEED